MQIPLRLRRRSLRRTVAAFLTISVASSLIAPAASAAGATPVFNPLQSATIGAIDSSARGKITDDQIDRPATTIPHTDFAVVDPVSKKPVDRTAVITAPSGNKVKAGDYYDRLNALETDLNKHGQSLRSGAKSFDVGTVIGGHPEDFQGTIRRAPQSAGRYTATTGSDRAHQAIVKDAVTLKETVPDTVTVTAPTAPPVTLTPQQVRLLKLVPYSPYGYKDSGFSPIPAPPPPAPPTRITLSKNYSETEGNKKLAAIGLDTSATAEAGPGNVGHVILSEDLSAYLLGKGGSIMSATADATPKNATVDMSALGDSIVSYTGPSLGGPAGAKSISLFNVSVPISVSIFTLTLAANASADFTSFNFITGHESYIDATISPYAAVSGNFSASIGVGDTSGDFGFGIAVGVNANLTIASIAMPLTASAGEPLTMLHSGTYKGNRSVYGCFLTFDGSLNSEINYTFLSGSLSVFLKGCFIFCDTIFNIRLVSWGGITGKDTLFHEEARKTASLAYSDLAQYGIPDPGTAFSKDDASGMPEACDDLQKGQHENGAFAS